MAASLPTVNETAPVVVPPPARPAVPLSAPPPVPVVVPPPAPVMAPDRPIPTSTLETVPDRFKASKRKSVAPAQGPKLAPVSDAQSSTQPATLEIFCGCARLTGAWAKMGAKGVAVDRRDNAHVPEVPVLWIDLTTAGGQQQVLDLIRSGEIGIVWLAVPCGTGSRAREKRIPKWLQDRGVPDAQPLRSDEFPEGLPSLTGKDAARVASANELVRFARRVVDLCDALRVFWVIENPANSILWLMKEFAELVRPDTVDVDYHACMHGGKRDKHQRLRTNCRALLALAVRCDKSHVHAPWGGKDVSRQV